MTDRDPNDEGIATGSAAGSWVDDLERLDAAVYAAIAATPTPRLDRAMARLSRAADYSKLSLSAAAAMWLLGGDTGRRAARSGLASLAVTAAVCNGPLKLGFRRPRPDRHAQEVPISRHVRMPVSRSFPSGHTAAAFAFATGVGEESAALGVPLRALATAVGYARVHTGVHYPGDVIAGAFVGVTIAELVTRMLKVRAET
jgi:membrane-associated phospholipid phosphatase